MQSLSERQKAVEERKRLILEAEQERKEAILHRTLLRDSKTEAKKKEKRSSLRNENHFAFGSSTPRSLHLDNAVLGPLRHSGGVRILSATPNHRSDYNYEDNFRRRPVSCIFSDEQKVDEIDFGSNECPPSKVQYTPCTALISEQVKACLTMTSFGDYNRSPNQRSTLGTPRENLMTQSLVIMSSGRKRHPELTPVITHDKETPSSLSSCKSRDSNYKLEENVAKVGPKRAISMTRLDQLAKPRQRYLEESLKLRQPGNLKTNDNANICMAKSMCNLLKSGLTENKQWMRKANSRNGPCSPPRPISSLSGTSDQSTTSSTVISRPKTARKPRPVSIAGCIPDNHSSDQVNEASSSTPTPSYRPNRARSAGSTYRQPLSRNTEPENKTPKPAPPRKPAHVKAAAAARKNAKQQQILKNGKTESPLTPKANKVEKPLPDLINEEAEKKEVVIDEEEAKQESDTNKETETSQTNQTSETAGTPEGSTNGKKEISEEEYKKILAEKRRQAREQAEREAELLKQQEEERIRAEEDRMRQEEEEQMRLAAELRRMEEEKLKRAIEEQKQREEEERKKQEEEAKLRAEKEEQEAKAKEEAEKAKIELEERLRREEEERLERRKRVEAIMSRTRKNPDSKKNLSNGSDGSRTPDSNDASPVRTMDESKNVAFQNQGIYLDVCD